MVIHQHVKRSARLIGVAFFSKHVLVLVTVSMNPPPYCCLALGCSAWLGLAGRNFLRNKIVYSSY